MRVLKFVTTKCRARKEQPGPGGSHSLLDTSHHAKLRREMIMVASSCKRDRMSWRDQAVSLE